MQARLLLALILVSVPATSQAGWKFWKKTTKSEKALASASPCSPSLLEFPDLGSGYRGFFIRACTPDSSPLWFMTVEKTLPVRVEARVSSKEFTGDERTRLEHKIKSMADHGIDSVDSDYLLREVGSLLGEAQRATSESEREQFQVRAGETMGEYLAR